MAQPKQDMRVTKTHKALAETMMSLLEVQPFQKITVNDICQKAMVSRSTFYLHFEDKYQLLAFCLQLEKEALDVLRREKDPREFLRLVIATVKERERAYRNLFVADQNVELLQMLRRYFQDSCSDILIECESQGAELAGPIPFLAVFYAEGLAGTILWWIENDFPYTVEEMALFEYNLLADVMPD